VAYLTWDERAARIEAWREAHRLRRAARPSWDLRNRYARKVARTLDVPIGEARAIIERDARRRAVRV
jgi:hypothetical protein